MTGALMLGHHNTGPRAPEDSAGDCPRVPLPLARRQTRGPAGRSPDRLSSEHAASRRRGTTLAAGPGHSGSCRQPVRREMATATSAGTAAAILGTPARAGRAPLRVLFCTDNLGIGGTELNALRTAEWLTESGIDVHVALLGADGPLRARYAACGIAVHPFPI